MPIHNQENNTQQSLSRREFLRLLMLLPTAAFVANNMPDMEDNKEEPWIIPTKYANYLVIFENHGKPASGEDLLGFCETIVPQIILYEYNYPSYKFMGVKVPDALSFKPSSGVREFVVPPDHQDILKEKKISFCFEGIKVSSDNKSIQQETNKVALGLGALITRIALGIRSNPSDIETIKTVSTLFSLWGFGDFVGSLALAKASENKTLASPEPWQKTLIEINGILSFAYPDREEIFLRNLFIARKLQFLGTRSINIEKPTLAVNIGGKHGGIIQLLDGHENLTLTLLGVIDKDSWKELLRINGGLDSFCTTPVFDPNTGTIISHKDQQLAELIQTKLQKERDN